MFRGRRALPRTDIFRPVRAEVAALDGQSDRLASALYGLTEDEITIVEGGA